MSSNSIPPPPVAPSELSESDRHELLSQYDFNAPESPEETLLLNPAELHELSRKQAQELDEDEEDIAPWEELANAVLVTIPLCFLYIILDIAVFAQYGQELSISTELGRLVNFTPALYILTFLVARPSSRQILPHSYWQSLLFLTCIGSGTTLIHLCSKSSYLKVMSQAPGIATLWIWCVVQLDLVPAVLGLVGVAGAVFLRGEGDSVIWWR